MRRNKTMLSLAYLMGHLGSVDPFPGISSLIKPEPIVKDKANHLGIPRRTNWKPRHWKKGRIGRRAK